MKTAETLLKNHKGYKYLSTPGTAFIVRHTPKFGLMIFLIERKKRQVWVPRRLDSGLCTEEFFPQIYTTKNACVEDVLDYCDHIEKL